MHKYLLLASELYSLPILRPLAKEALVRGHQVAWLAKDAIATRLQPNETRLRSWRELRAFAADATFSTVNHVPRLLPGLQVQLFHGLNMHKRDPLEGQLRVRGLFDLYCTHGPATTAPLRAIARERGDFVVVETGWPKVDALFRGHDCSHAAVAVRAAAQGRPIVLYASTFNEPLSRARECLETLEALVARGDRYWLLCLHPMTAPDLVKRYRQLAGDNAVFLDADRLPDLLPLAQALVCDTTSVAEEFALMGKPIVTVRHRRPQPFMTDVLDPQQIDPALHAALAAQGRPIAGMEQYAHSVHPYCDGRSVARVLDATADVLAGVRAPLKPRIRKPWRRWWRSRSEMRELLPESGTAIRFAEQAWRLIGPPARAFD